jgi:uncharacterized membrane protein
MSARSFPLATLLTLVSATLGAAQDMPEDVTAAGNEPFWRVDIAGGDFTLSRPDYEPLMLSVVERRTEADGTTVIVSASSSPAFSAFLSLAPGPCADTMADQTYPYTATLELGDTVLQGCGGDPRDLLTAEEVWTVTEIAGEPIVPGTEVTMSFADSGAVGQRRMQPLHRALRVDRRGPVARSGGRDADGLPGRHHGEGTGLLRRLRRRDELLVLGGGGVAADRPAGTGDRGARGGVTPHPPVWLMCRMTCPSTFWRE